MPGLKKEKRMVTSVFIHGNEDTSEPLEIRREVFVEEQGWPESTERDRFDETALHLMVYVDEIPAATGRIWRDGRFRIGRLAVRKQFRGQKIGDLALRLLVYKAFSSGAKSISAGVQTYIAPLYKKFGFKECGEESTYAGRPCIEMRVNKGDVVYPSAY
jgi:predicted GNAT family N-acyltransferase